MVRNGLRIVVMLIGVTASFAAAQTSASLADALKNPKGVEDLFLSCPFIGIDEAKTSSLRPWEASWP